MKFCHGSFWHKVPISEQHLWGTSDALFPRALVGIDTTGRFNTIGLDRSPWRSPSRIVKIVKDAFCSVGLPPYSPHSVRKAIVELANEHCHTPEEFKAWSQNLGHEEVLTTFMNYGTLSPGRQMELIGRMRDSVGPKVSEQEFH